MFRAARVVMMTTATVITKTRVTRGGKTVQVCMQSYMVLHTRTIIKRLLVLGGIGN